MNIYDFMFIIGFLLIAIVTGIKFYNIMSIGKMYDLKLSFLMFAGFLLSWLIELGIWLFYPERLLYMLLFQISNLLLILMVLFTVIEIIFFIKETSLKVIEPNMSNTRLS